jgi:hypothetical protein
MCKFAPVEEDEEGLIPCHDDSCSELGTGYESESKEDDEMYSKKKKRRRKRLRKVDQIQEQEKDQWVEELHSVFKKVSAVKIADFWWADAWAIIGRV